VEHIEKYAPLIKHLSISLFLLVYNYYAHKEDCKIGVEFLFLSWDDVKGIWGNKSLAKPKMLQMVQPKNQSEI
jgi:hypothetical protein